MASARRVLDAARDSSVPVVFTVIGYEDGVEVAWFDKMPQLATLRSGSPWCNVDTRLARREDELVLTKGSASAAFDTELLAILETRNVDSVVVLGVTTSGCVRATAVDLVSSGFAVLVPAEAVGDRAAGPHDASLVDIDAKYGDVVSESEVIAYLKGKA